MEYIRKQFNTLKERILEPRIVWEAARTTMTLRRLTEYLLVIDGVAEVCKRRRAKTWFGAKISSI